jgi:hypothetical protein
MGTQHGGNGDNVPPDGDRSQDPSHDPELPALPPEWGAIAIPDDLSELADEAEQVRQELARERREGRTPRHSASSGGGEPSIGVPLLIMSVAVIITLVSLFAMTWSGSNTLTPDGASTQRPTQLPALTLADGSGEWVSLADRVPMAIMLVEECECSALIASTVAAAPSGVTVVAIDQSPPPMPAGLAETDPRPLLLEDPTGRVRAQLDLGPAPLEAATVVLVNQDGQITSIQEAVTALARFQPDLTNLAPA